MFCAFVSDDYDDVGGDEFEPLSPDQSPMEQMFGMSDQEIPVKYESLFLFLQGKTGPEVIKLFPFSIQLSMKF